MKKTGKSSRAFHFILALILSIIFTLLYHYSILHHLVYLPLIIGSCFLIFQLSFIFISNRASQLKLDVEYLELQKVILQQHKKSFEVVESNMKQRLSRIRLILEDVDKELSLNHMENVQSLFHSLETSLEPSNHINYCDNKVINVILQTKSMECTHKGIHFSHDIIMPEPLDITSPKLISLFFNLLNNAIEACEKSQLEYPFISLTIDYRGDYLFISMKNSKSSAITFDHQTTKEQPFYHGLGLSIIEEIVHEQDGFYQWKDMNQTFCSTIMLRYRK